MGIGNLGYSVPTSTEIDAKLLHNIGFSRDIVEHCVGQSGAEPNPTPVQVPDVKAEPGTPPAPRPETYQTPENTPIGKLPGGY